MIHFYVPIVSWRGICASFYFLGKYDEAVAACLNPYTHLEISFVNRFVKGCEWMIFGEEKANEKQAYMTPQINKFLNSSLY
jgi:hypothetical protein